jgi:hypothetical protein
MRAKITNVSINRDLLSHDVHLRFTAIITAEDAEGQAEILALAKVSGELELGPISCRNMSIKELGQHHRLLGAELVRRLMIASNPRQCEPQCVKSDAQGPTKVSSPIPMAPCQVCGRKGTLYGCRRCGRTA